MGELVQGLEHRGNYTQEVGGSSPSLPAKQTRIKYMVNLFIDLETYSSVDIKTAGAYKYIASPDFEILLIAFAVDDGETRIIDCTSYKNQDYYDFERYLLDPTVIKHAHNAIFERLAFKRVGLDIPAEQWRCSAIKAGYCGLPLSLADVSKALNLGDQGKSAAGKKLIQYFCCPQKPTKANGGRTRNHPQHAPEKWEEFKKYCIQDVEAEREIIKRLSPYIIPPTEQDLYVLDQKINDRGILVDPLFATNAVRFDEAFAVTAEARMIELTGVANPNSAAQLKSWLSEAMQKDVTTLAKASVTEMLEGVEAGAVKEVLELRGKLAKSSTKKYLAMLNSKGEDNRIRGLFQFYGANRTGRWAGRLVQMQNLPQNHISDLQVARDLVTLGDYELTNLMYDDIPSLLSQLIRTAFIAPEGKTFAVADFSAIEARVIAWLADEKWRLDVFKTHGKIYEASAAMMFNVPIEEVTKGSELRGKGKIAELALGYQGAVGALKTMGGEKMGLSEPEMDLIVKRWRKANPAIVQMWGEIEEAAKEAIQNRCKVPTGYRGVTIRCDASYMIITLPSGRELFYASPQMATNRFGQSSIKYKGMDQVTKQWGWVESYGGKLTENIVQAIARDLLAESLTKLDKKGFKVVMHVHDEAVVEVELDGANAMLHWICEIMGQDVVWAKGLPLKADGYLTPFYKKD